MRCSFHVEFLTSMFLKLVGHILPLVTKNKNVIMLRYSAGSQYNVHALTQQA